MFRLRTAAAICGILVLSGCDDGTRPELVGARLQIYADGIPYDERTISTTATLKLAGNVLDSQGDILEGEVVEWVSTAPEVASLDVEMGGSVIVSARSVGTARIIARHEIGEDTAVVNVAAGLAQSELPVCSDRPAQAMARGEVKVFSGAEVLPLCLAGGAAEPGEYTMMVMNSGETAASQLNILLHATGVAAATAGPNPQLRPSLTLSAQDRFHARLREQVSGRLEPLLASGAGSLQLPAPRPQSTVGQLIPFNVETTSADGCTAPTMRSGRVRYISDHAIVVADTANPAGGFTDADYAAYGEFFDDNAWPLVIDNFGEPSDIDGNGKVFIFFTRSVNDLNSSNSGSIVGGFFFNRDLFPKSTCAGSNVAEMFYMLVPNPAPAAGERPFTRGSVDRATRNVLVHEFQHLVNDSRRLHVNRSPVWEETWLNEGLSHIAEELMFYRSSGLAPRTNIGRAPFADLADRESFRQFQLDNLERLSLFLANPEYFSLIGNDVLATRGASWLFLRYAADRRGGTERDLWRALVRDSKISGLDNLRAAIGEAPLQWISDWGVAMYLDDTGLSTDARYSLPSWNFRDLYQVARTYWPGTLDQSYPLRVSQLQESTGTTLPLQGAGLAHRRLGVPAGEKASVRITVSPGGGQRLLPVPSRVKVAVVRTR